MVETSWARAAHRFGEWYSSASLDELWIPSRLRNREWMMANWGGSPPNRHIGFNTPNQLLNYCQSRVPHSCFYSTAYYDDPSQRKMNDKGWRGADLVFDLDGDHLDYVDPFDFPSMLNIIQEQAWLLWSDFLQPEFGFDEKHLHTTFSGHRGFHLHYRAPDILQLDSNARRELVNYVRGLGVDVSVVRNNSSGGWKQRMEQGTQIVLEKLDALAEGDSESKSVMNELLAIVKGREGARDSKVKGVGKKRMNDLAERVQHPARRENIISGNYKGLKELEPIFHELIKGDQSIILQSAGETDEAVTVDVKRVIRWPTSLHGKCGLQVTTIPLERLNPASSNPFDALQEAVPRFDDKNTQVEISAERCVVRLGNETLELERGEQFSANANLETFLTLKGWGNPVVS